MKKALKFSHKVVKYGHVPLFFELILRCFNKLVEILIGSMHANTMYRDRVSVFVWCTLVSAVKTAYPE